MSIFPCETQTARSVAHALFALEFVSELEEREHDLSGCSGKDLTTLIEPVEDARILPVLAHLVGMIEASWGASIVTVFYHMGVKTEAEKFSALLDLCLGAEGHGVSIADSFGEQLSNAATVLECPLPPNPLSHDYEGFTELAMEVYDERFPAGNPQSFAA